MNSFQRLAINMGAVAFLITGCQLISQIDWELPDNPDNGNTVEPEDKYTEQDHWDALADFVEGGSINDTDQLTWVVNHLKSSGYLDDVSRIGVWAQELTPITERNQKEIADILRGGGTDG